MYLNTFLQIIITFKFKYLQYSKWAINFKIYKIFLIFALLIVKSCIKAPLETFLKEGGPIYPITFNLYLLLEFVSKWAIVFKIFTIFLCSYICINNCWILYKSFFEKFVEERVSQDEGGRDKEKYLLTK